MLARNLKKEMEDLIEAHKAEKREMQRQMHSKLKEMESRLNQDFHEAAKKRPTYLGGSWNMFCFLAFLQLGWP